MNRITSIRPLDRTAMERAQRRWNNVGKPLHSLGLLERDIIQIAGIIGSEMVQLKRRCAVIFCADNGVVAEGVTQTDSSVTKAVAEAIAGGTSSINRLAGLFSADVFAVDVGMNTRSISGGIIDRRVAGGTQNIAERPAMSESQARKAISAGIDMVRDCAEKGYDIIVSGEMGIGNTTTSAAIASVLLNKKAEDITGRGAGLDDEGLKRKINAVRRAVDINRPDENDAVDILSKLGGFDIAAMAGTFLGGGIYRVPIVIDGFISAIAAALAYKLCPHARDYMLCSHVSAEPAGMEILRLIGLKPLITAEMHLGEGTGGMFLIPLLDGALSVYGQAHSFDDLKIKHYEDYKCSY